MALRGWQMDSARTTRWHSCREEKPNRASHLEGLCESRRRGPPKVFKNKIGCMSKLGSSVSH